MSLYLELKKIFSFFIPKKFLFKHEEKFRSLLYLFYKGKKFQCSICEKKLNTFTKTLSNDFLCPFCGSLQRNRRLWLLLKNEFLKPNSIVLDFSPSRCLYRKMKKIKDIDYQSTDLSGDFIAENQFDITKIDVKNESYDLIICYHILEHIENDTLAMSELFRVLKPNSKILIQTPFKEGEIYENPEIIALKERLKHFGQEDHVRIYSINGLKLRLENAGFLIEIKTDFKDEHYLGLDKNETILIASKM